MLAATQSQTAVPLKTDFGTRPPRPAILLICEELFGQASRIRAAAVHPPSDETNPKQTASLETEVFGQRLSAEFDRKGQTNPQNSRCRPHSATQTLYNVGRSWNGGNRRGACGLPGGERWIRTRGISRRIAYRAVRDSGTTKIGHSKNPHDGHRAALVWAEDGEGIAVSSVHESLHGGRRDPEQAILSERHDRRSLVFRRLAIAANPRSGMANHFGRLAAS